MAKRTVKDHPLSKKKAIIVKMKTTDYIILEECSLVLNIFHFQEGGGWFI